MTSTYRRALTWSDALELLNQAERLHQQMFAPRPASARKPAWEPPVDMIETDDEVFILAALPGADPKNIEARIEDGYLILSGERVLPVEFRAALIHRLELPQGAFLRRLALPPNRYESIQLSTANNCIVIRLTKAV